MKTTKVQKEVIETLKNILNYWLSTNDINSPSHHTLIEDEIQGIDSLSEEEKDTISDEVFNLYNSIKYLAC